LTLALALAFTATAEFVFFVVFLLVFLTVAGRRRGFLRGALLLPLPPVLPPTPPDTLADALTVVGLEVIKPPRVCSSSFCAEVVLNVTTHARSIIATRGMLIL
jgi:hypothetical protein